MTDHDDRPDQDPNAKVEAALVDADVPGTVPTDGSEERRASQAQFGNLKQNLVNRWSVTDA